MKLPRQGQSWLGAGRFLTGTWGAPSPFSAPSTAIPLHYWIGQFLGAATSPQIRLPETGAVRLLLRGLLTNPRFGEEPGATQGAAGGVPERTSSLCSEGRGSRAHHYPRRRGGSPQRVEVYPGGVPGRLLGRPSGSCRSNRRTVGIRQPTSRMCLGSGQHKRFELLSISRRTVTGRNRLQAGILQLSLPPDSTDSTVILQEFLDWPDRVGPRM
jgi:hypothetical protein